MEENESWLDCDDGCILVISTRAPRFSKYMVQICGSDCVYGLKRDFLTFKGREQSWGVVCYNYGKLRDGIYEVSVSYFRHRADDVPFCRERYFLILTADGSRVFPYDSMNDATVLMILDAIRCGYYVLPPE